MGDELERYARHEILPEIGRDGQRLIGEASVLLVGCGALGSNAATLLVRAGVRLLRVVDPDVPTIGNLHRQVLFDEDDVARGEPKAEVAAAKLRRVNSDVTVEPHVAAFGRRNARDLVGGIDVVVDATDNFETRYVLNDACVEAGVPWIYAGVVGVSGLSLTVLPGVGPCLRCLFPTPPEPGAVPTTAEAGVLGTVPALLADVQVTEALKVVLGVDGLGKGLFSVDLWRRDFRDIPVSRDPDCPCCGRRRFPFLSR